jgi:hypothetical protein
MNLSFTMHHFKVIYNMQNFKWITHGRNQSTWSMIIFQFMYLAIELE